MNVVLIGNYHSAELQSMQRFAAALRYGLEKRGVNVRVVAARSLLAAGRNPHRGLGKWLSYIDMFILFPIELRAIIRKSPPDTVFHICDHGNSVYVRLLKDRAHLSTLHDMLNIRAAFGESTDCVPTLTGRLLHRWILHSLNKCKSVICDSTSTAQDFRRFSPKYSGKLGVVLLGQNFGYKRLPEQETWKRLSADTPLKAGERYVLNVGSSVQRKNREGCLRIFSRMAPEVAGRLVFAGGSLTREQRDLAASLGLNGRVLELQENITNETLEALYNGAHALLFPTKAEGFGWPVLEAQACGCPVVCSDRTSVPEVAGDGALIHDVDDEDAFCESLRRLTDESVREELIGRGISNSKRMTTDRMIDGYHAVYEELLKARA
ncbi:MAG: glycosyltransferase family 1 protein [Terrimicrobiaceae bacterium]|nr:glycosyltransferase family 1 protein [Terrimicrobiaceae bacterium]